MTRKRTARRRGLYAILIALLAGAILPSIMARTGIGARLGLAPEGEDDYARELRSYVWGLGLAVVLTAIPFALVHWALLPHSWLAIAIAVFALVQMVVHFRFFLHIDPPNQNTDDLLLILFTTLILIAMAGGTLWILWDLSTRMMA